jgi:hypothetical protein
LLNLLLGFFWVRHGPVNGSENQELKPQEKVNAHENKREGLVTTCVGILLNERNWEE